MPLLQVHTDHSAAVRALAWSPHRNGLLVSGGGTADRHLRFWDILTGQQLQWICTGSQVTIVALHALFYFEDRKSKLMI